MHARITLPSDILTEYVEIQIKKGCFTPKAAFLFFKFKPYPKSSKKIFSSGTPNSCNAF